MVGIAQRKQYISVRRNCYFASLGWSLLYQTYFFPRHSSRRREREGERKRKSKRECVRSHSRRFQSVLHVYNDVYTRIKYSRRDTATRERERERRAKQRVISTSAHRLIEMQTHRRYLARGVKQSLSCQGRRRSRRGVSDETGADKKRLPFVIARAAACKIDRIDRSWCNSRYQKLRAYAAAGIARSARWIRARSCVLVAARLDYQFASPWEIITTNTMGPTQ